jgi:hypothetical protein
MKKLSILFAVLLVLGFTVPALADVNVFATVDKDKLIFVDQVVLIFKDICVDVEVDLTLYQAAEADSNVNQSNVANIVRGHANPEVRDENFRSAEILSSINSNSGIVGVNQDAGNFNNQGNIASIAATVGDVTAATPQYGYADAEASASQYNFENAEITVEGYPVYTSVQKYDLIQGSILGNSGIVGVNQSVGNLNNQLNQVVMSVGDGVAVAMAEADLGQYNALNLVAEIGTYRTDTITGSINNNTGIVGVNQSSGNMNNQANIVSIAATR